MMNTLAFISPGGGELILIMLVLILLFGAKDAPRMLRKFQSFMDEIRRIANGFRYDMMYSDLHTPDPTESEEKAEMFEDAEEGEFEEYNFEDDYGTHETEASNNQDEDAEKTDQ